MRPAPTDKSGRFSRTLAKWGRNGGFALVETAIVLAISSLFVIGFLKFYEVTIQKQRIETTKHRLEDLRRSLAFYAATKERLPCPASPVVHEVVLMGKKAQDAPDACGPDAPPAEGVVVYSDSDRLEHGTTEVWTGLVPAAALGLSLDQMKDGWGNNFSYAVSRKLTLPEGLRGSPEPEGDIDVVDGDGNSVFDKPATGRWVIVSHGPSGEGAWGEEGIRKPCEPGTLSAQNCSDEGVYISAPFSRKAGPAFYDNILIHDDAGPESRLLEHLALCYRKYAFYAPRNPQSDKDGCLGRPYVWHGGCMVFSNPPLAGGAIQPFKSALIKTPGISSGVTCSCTKDYLFQPINGWTSSFVTVPPAGYPLAAITQLTTCLR